MSLISTKNGKKRKQNSEKLGDAPQIRIYFAKNGRWVYLLRVWQEYIDVAKFEDMFKWELLPSCLYLGQVSISEMYRKKHLGAFWESTALHWCRVQRTISAWLNLEKDLNLADICIWPIFELVFGPYLIQICISYIFVLGLYLYLYKFVFVSGPCFSLY